MDSLFIVVYRDGQTSRWKAMHEGEFTERRMAENFIECKRATGWGSFRFAIVEGPIVSQESMAEAEARLGAF